MRNGSRALVAAACAAPFIVFFGVYLPAAGHGFISDDFGWLLHNRISTPSDLWRIVRSDNGFYRPVVALSFAANYLTSGLNARAYGLTNVALATLCGVSVYLLCRALNLPRGAATFASALWLLNLHGVNMSILWISGRTALLATAAAASCAAALLSGRHLLATMLLTVAVFSREDAALLPLVGAMWLYVLQRAPRSAGLPLALADRRRGYRRRLLRHPVHHGCDDPSHCALVLPLYSRSRRR